MKIYSWAIVDDTDLLMDIFTSYHSAKVECDIMNAPSADGSLLPGNPFKIVEYRSA
jgi:hypothetical protein